MSDSTENAAPRVSAARVQSTASLQEVSPSQNAGLRESGASVRHVPTNASSLPKGRLQIGELALKLHGVDRASARRITERAMQLASEKIPADVHGNFASLRLHVRPRRHTEAGMSEAIADAIARAVTGREEDGRA